MVAGIFNVAALRRERPSEIVVLYRLTQIAARAITLGMVVALAFGIWLVADLDFVKWSNAWVIIALILWVVASGVGGAGGRSRDGIRRLSEQLRAVGVTSR